jgi:hypothetical protein
MRVVIPNDRQNADARCDMLVKNERVLQCVILYLFDRCFVEWHGCDVHTFSVEIYSSMLHTFCFCMRFDGVITDLSIKIFNMCTIVPGGCSYGVFTKYVYELFHCISCHPRGS